MHSQNTVFPHPYHEIDPNFTHAHTSIGSTDLKFQYDTSIGKLNWRAKFQTVNRCRSSTDLKFQYDTSIGKLNWRANFQTVNRCRSLSFTLHVPSKFSVSTPYDEIVPNFTHAHTSICSTDLKFQYDTSIGKLNWRAKFQTVNRCRNLSFTLHVPSKYSVSTPYDEIDPNFTHVHTSICSTDLKFQYDTSIGKLNWRAKFQTVNRCRSLSFTLHVPSKYSVSTPYDEIDPNFTHAHTSICSTDLKFQYDTSIGKLSWHAKFQTVNRCRSLSFTLHAQSKYSVSTPLSRNRPQFHTRAYFYMFDWPEISVWYFNWQVKLTCKVSDSKSMSKFVFYTTCTVKIQCFHTPITKSTPFSHTRMILYVQLTWNFSMILQFAS